MNAVYRIRRGEGVASLQLGHADHLPLLPDEVRIRMHAVSLDFRDLLVAKGQMGAGDVRIPASDGAGVVVEIGSAVTRLAKAIAWFRPSSQNGWMVPPDVRLGRAALGDGRRRGVARNDGSVGRLH